MDKKQTILNTLRSIALMLALMTAAAAGVRAQAPSFTTHPQPQTAPVDGTAKFGAAATGGTVSYQWQWSSDGSAWNNISNDTWFSGATSANLTFAGVGPAWNGRLFRCVASNASGSRNSNTAKLTVVAATYTISASPARPNFGTLPASYSPPAAQTVTVTNTGNSAVTLNALPAVANYILTTLTATNLAAGGTATFTIRPNTGLAAGTYSPTFSVTGSNGASVAISPTFTVAPAPVITAAATGLTGLQVGTPVSGASITYSLSLLSGYTFAAVMGGYGAAFDVTGLPAGLTAGTPVRSSDGRTVTLPVTGTPTTANAATVTIGLPATIPAAFITGSTNPGAVTGTVTAGPVEPVAPVYGISLVDRNGEAFPSPYSFPPLSHTYTNSIYSPQIGIKNTGNQPTGELFIARTGGDAVFFNNIGAISSVPVGETFPAYITIHTDTDLPAGTYSATFTVSGDNGISATFTINLTVTQSADVPVITNDAILPDATVGVPYRVTFAATGVTPISWSHSYSNESGHFLPLYLNSNTGDLAGTPTTEGEYIISVLALNSAGISNKKFSLRVAPATAPVITTGSPLSGGTVGVAYSQTLAATSNTPVSWSVRRGSALPAGLTLNASTGEISGTPTTAGTLFFFIRAENSAGYTDKEFSITIAPATAPAFVAVTGITGVPASTTAGTPLALTGTVAPANATNQTIVWSVKNAGATGATVSGSTLNTTAAGTATVTATVANGLTATTPYTQDFTVSVAATTATTYIVQFDADGGSPTPASQTVAAGARLTEPAAPAKTNYLFTGWYDGAYRWNFATDAVNGAMTLKAGWDVDTGNDAVLQPTLKAWTVDGALYATGLTAGAPLSVYSLTGVQIYSGVALDVEMQCIASLPARGVYIIRHAGQTAKVVN